MTETLPCALELLLGPPLGKLQNRCREAADSECERSVPMPKLDVERPDHATDTISKYSLDPQFDVFGVDSRCLHALFPGDVLVASTKTPRPAVQNPLVAAFRPLAVSVALGFSCQARDCLGFKGLGFRA